MSTVRVYLEWAYGSVFNVHRLIIVSAGLVPPALRYVHAVYSDRTRPNRTAFRMRNRPKSWTGMRLCKCHFRLRYFGGALAAIHTTGKAIGQSGSRFTVVTYVNWFKGPRRRRALGIRSVRTSIETCCKAVETYTKYYYCCCCCCSDDSESSSVAAYTQLQGAHMDVLNEGRIRGDRKRTVT